MKKLFLLVTLFMVACTSSFAGTPITKSENDSAIQAGRTELYAKITQLQSNINASPASSATSQSVADVQAILIRGMNQTRVSMMLDSKSNFAAINTRYLKMEQASYQFRLLSADVPLNSTKLVKYAQDFLADY